MSRAHGHWTAPALLVDAPRGGGEVCDRHREMRLGAGQIALLGCYHSLRVMNAAKMTPLPACSCLL
jgi:hypothetical protein